jgi:hypothetical protein
MDRLYKRPMFRKGGSANSNGTGITSGLAPRQGYATNENNTVKQDDLSKIDISNMNLQQLKDLSQRMSYKAPPMQSNNSLNDFLINFGLDIASRSPEGNIFQTAAASAKEPFKNFQASKAAYNKEINDRSINKYNSESDIFTTLIEAQSKIKGSDTDRGFALSDKLEKLEKVGQEKQTLLAIDADIGLLRKYIIENSIPGETEADKYDNAKKAIKDRLKIVNSALKVLEPKDEYTLAFLKSGRAGQFWQTIIQSEVKAQGVKSDSDPTFDWNRVIERASGGNKDGGIVGYAEGGLTEMVSEETMGEGTEMEEEIMTEQSAGSSDPLTYEQLRQRLPKEIPDDVIKLIASSDEALLAFSNIATQQDLNEFNVKYGVELVLPPS